MNQPIRVGLFVLIGTLVGVEGTQAQLQYFPSHQSQSPYLQAQYANQGFQPVAYCGESGGYGCGCDSGCCESGCCEPGCCCESSCCCEPGCCCESYGCTDCSYSCGGAGKFYGDVEFMLMRAHIAESIFGKLSEEYELAPRFSFGFENCNGQGARVRYWHYGHHLNNLLTVGGVRFEWDVVDLEFTNRFQSCRTGVVLSGGVRYANAGIESGGVTDDVDLIGLTMAADAQTLLCCGCNSYYSAIYGGRLSILGGDWERQGADLERDDSVVAHELYLGFEYGCSSCGYDMYSQLKLEIQNWHSDFLGGIGNGYSVGFFGPSWTVGVAF